jgi:NAD(P)-dependent dehydrogenase (short-subunit alcohol dehydrogenase family)
MARPTAIVVGVGAEEGIGAAVSRRFAREGFHVTAAGRTQAKLDAVVATIRAAGGSAEGLLCDATDENEVAGLFARAFAAPAGFAPPEVVVFNAGDNRRIPFRETEAALFEAFWRVGCFAGFLVGREAARKMAPLGRGTILFTGASGSLRG